MKNGSDNGDGAHRVLCCGNESDVLQHLHQDPGYFTVSTGLRSDCFSSRSSLILAESDSSVFKQRPWFSKVKNVKRLCLCRL